MEEQLSQLSGAEVITTAGHPVVLGQDALEALALLLAQGAWSQSMILADTNTVLHCYPRLPKALQQLPVLILEPGEHHKHLDSCQRIWRKMTELGADRRSLLLNLGGGVIGDMGGFAAACYKRGIDFIHLPSTLLAMTDASIGGKVGVDFDHLKNHIGAFRQPAWVITYPPFLETLPPRELQSGFAEVVKHYLIADAARWQALRAAPGIPADRTQLIADSVRIKGQIVVADTEEQGLRKALNFGHTVGHAVESYYMQLQPGAMLHGEAVALGMVCEAWLSVQQGCLSEAELQEITTYLHAQFPRFSVPDPADPTLHAYLLQDKKNQDGAIRCTLLDGIGSFKVDVELPLDLVASSLDYYRNS